MKFIKEHGRSRRAEVKEEEKRKEEDKVARVGRIKKKKRRGEEERSGCSLLMLALNFLVTFFSAGGKVKAKTGGRTRGAKEASEEAVSRRSLFSSTAKNFQRL